MLDSFGQKTCSETAHVLTSLCSETNKRYLSSLIKLATSRVARASETSNRLAICQTISRMSIPAVSPLQMIAATGVNFSSGLPATSNISWPSELEISLAAADTDILIQLLSLASLPDPTLRSVHSTFPSYGIFY